MTLEWGFPVVPKQEYTPYIIIIIIIIIITV